MEGKLFLLDKATPPPTSRYEIFAFDLQRFATLGTAKTATISTVTDQYKDSASDKTTKPVSRFTISGGTETKYNSKAKAAAAAIAANATATDVAGAKFAVAKTTTTDGTTTATITYYDSEDDFKTETFSDLTENDAIAVFSDITLKDNIGTADNPIKSTIKVMGEVTLDLNGKKLYNNNSYAAIWVQNDSATAELTLQDSGTGGQIVYNWVPDGAKANGTPIDLSTANSTQLTSIAKAYKGSGGREKAAIKLGYSSTAAGDWEGIGTNQLKTNPPLNQKVGLTMKSGTITANSSAISAGDNSSISIQDGCTVESNNSCGIYFGNSSSASAKDSTLTMKGGTIRTNEYSNFPAIQVSGTPKYTTTLDIQGGTIEFTNEDPAEADTDGKKKGEIYYGNPNAIYLSGRTILNVSGGTITSTETGIEFRAGELNITGGTITSTATEYKTAKQKDTKTQSGASTFGTAIAIAQNSNGNDIKVNISGDSTNISGPNAIAVSNPVEIKDDTVSIGKVSATINGGNLRSTTPSVTGDSTKGGNAILADKANVAITVNNGNLNGNVTVSKIDALGDEFQNATVVVSGGTTTGTVQVLEKKTTGDDAGKETEKTDEGSLQVLGGKISDTTSANKYVATGSKVSSDGTVTESSENKWSVVGGNNLHHSYVLVGSVPSLNASIIDVTIGSAADSVYLKYDETNKLLSVPFVDNETSISLASADKYRGRYLAQQTVVGSAASIKPMTAGVKITGAGFFKDSGITMLTTANSATTSLASLGVVVDATDNALTYIKGGAGQDSIKAGNRRSTLDGGDSDDTLDGGDGIDTFYYSAGKDVINNYNVDDDIVSLTGAELNPPIDFTNNDARFDGTNFVFNFATDKTLTFRNAAEVSFFGADNKRYTYQGYTGGGMNYISVGDEAISLGANYGNRFNGTLAANEDYKTIDAARVKNAIRIIGNDNDNYIVASSVGGGTLEGGEGDDTLMVADDSAASLRFEGGAGSDSLVGGNGYNVFVYTEGSDSISGYHNNDIVTIRGNAANLETAEFSFKDNNIELSFEGNEDDLTFEGISGIPNGVSVQSGKNLYVYKKDRIARNDEVITLTSGFEAESFGSDIYNTINALNANKAVSIVGNDNNNVIFGSKQGGTLFGGAGNDKLDVTEREANKTFVFKYTEGKDTVSGFIAGDKLEITPARLEQIAKAKSSKSDTRLAFTFNTSKSDVLTFNSEDEIGRVSLSGNNGFLTKDGVVSIDSGESGNRLDLFSSAKGKIDLTDTLYSVSGGIKTVDASDVAKQSVTLIGASVESGSSYTFAGNNKKKDQFEYNGGNVTISGYEAGKDRFDLNTAALTGFSVDSADNGNVSLSGLGTDEIVVLEGMKKKEVLLHHAGSRRNSFTKMVFKETGVILNKEKRPTAATVSASYDASGDNTVKKIFVADGADNISITAGDRNKTTLDASAASGVSLIGGAKNDKLIGSTVAADTFIYTGGKDIIQNYGSSEKISLGSFATSLTSAKISAGSRSIKFKFSNKNSLTIKPAKGSTLGSALDISGIPNYTYAKNAIISGSNATLTSESSGSYRLKNSGVNNVDGSRVEKNLTYRGTSDAETLTGGTKKTTFKGGGGNDAFTGGTGNDIFFYAKGNSGNVTIADFDYNKDKLKIAGGTITDISTVSGGIKFDMNSGKKGSANIGSFTIGNIIEGYGSDGKATGNTTKKAVIKANNTYLWFADEAVTDSSGNVLAQAGDLITADSKVSKSQVSNYAVIDLGYSSNLVNAGIATKAGEFDFTATGITKETTNNG